MDEKKSDRPIDRATEYLETVARLEADISPVDTDAALTSIAISLKRIADVMENPKIRKAPAYDRPIRRS